MDSDKTLVHAWKEGDQNSFDLLYDKYKDMAMRTAFFICQNRADCEDILQETFITCYLHIGELKQEEDFKTWMLKIMIRKAYRTVKKQKKEIAQEELTQTQLMQTQLSQTQLSQTQSEQSNSSLLDGQIKKEKRLILTHAIGELPEKHRIVIILYYYNELSVSEIAKITGSFEGTVKSRLFTARNRLKSILSQEVSYENEWI